MNQRIFGTLALVLPLAVSPHLVAASETYDLRAKVAPDDLTEVAIRLEGGGTLKIAEKDKIRSLAMRVDGELAYHERLLESNSDTRRSARHYQRSQATIAVEKSKTNASLAENRRAVGATATAEKATLYCPEGPFTRDELELIDVPFNSLLINGLLPDHPVAQGESWKQSAALMAGLLNLDAVSSTDVESTLKEMNDKQRAVVQVSGSLAGAIDGVATEIEIKCQYLADLERHRIVSLAVNIKETRPIGHVGPGLSVVAKLRMTVKPLADSAQLAPGALLKFSGEPKPAENKLLYGAASGGVRLLYDRRWHVISETPDLAVLRYVDRGELVAQCNLASRGKPDGDKQVSLGKFQAEIEKALGQNFGRFLDAADETTPSGTRILRVTVEGKASELAIQWNYYRAETKDGRSATFAFMLEKELIDRFGDAGKTLVDGLEFPETPATATSLKMKLNR